MMAPREAVPPLVRGRLLSRRLHSEPAIGDAYPPRREGAQSVVIWLRKKAHARVYNFSAGPAVLPEEVLSRAAAEMLDYHGCGMSVMEMSHRSPVFQGILSGEAEADLRQLMGVPDDYGRCCFCRAATPCSSPQSS